MQKLIKYLESLEDERKEFILKFHKDHLPLMLEAKGSMCNHQAWKGGYLDHIQECFNIAESIYGALCKIHSLPFKLSECFVVLYFHDIEKIWKYTINEIIDKKLYYKTILQENYSIIFSEQEQNALKYIHGENEYYSSKKRVMNELAAFCHSVDTISSRIWHGEGAQK
jgi:hypothetical protein